MTSAEQSTRSRAMVDQTSRLVEFLRSLAAAGSPPVLDVDRHESVLWLVDKPDEAELDATAGPGEPLFELEPLPVEPVPALPSVLSGLVSMRTARNSSADVPPLAEPVAPESPPREPAGPTDDVAPEPPEHPVEVTQAYALWAEERKAWAEHDQRTAPARRWYEQLSETARHLEQQDDVLELVLAVGLLSVRTPQGVVRNHVLSTRLAIAVDATTAALRISVPEVGQPRLHDRDLLDGFEGFEARRADQVRADIRSGEVSLLDDDVHELLERWRALALPSSGAYEKDWQAQTAATDVATLRFAPALVVRRRDNASLLAYYDRMSEVLSGPDAEAPLGLAQLLTSIDADERAAWLTAEGGSVLSAVEEPLFPLPANEEQAAIIKRLRHDTGVVVQGPPGTGKTHTIANLVSALVAEGQRVLVTSQKAQALSVLREKLPEEVRELCVSMTDQARGGSTELARSVNAMVDRHASYDAVRYASQITDVGSRRDAALSRTVVITEKIRALREAETYQHPPIAHGYAGTLGTITAALQAAAPAHDWMPVPLPEAAPAALPMDAEAVAELVRLTATVTPEREARVHQHLPEQDRVLSPQAVRDLVTAERDAMGRAADADAGTAAALDALTDEAFQRVADGVERLDGLLSQLSTSGDVDTGWQQQYLDAALRGRELSLWASLRQVSGGAESLAQQASQVQLRDIVLPDFEPTGERSRAGQLAAGRALLRHAAEGGKVRTKGMFRSSAEKQAELLLTATVDGLTPTNPELLELVVTAVAVDADADALTRRWAEAGLDVPPAGTRGRRVAALLDAHHDLTRCDEALALIAEVRQQLVAEGVHLRLDTRESWRLVSAAMPAVRAHRRAAAASAAVESARDALEVVVSAEHAAPDCRRLLVALATRDAPGYDQAYDALATARLEREQQRRVEQLTAEVGRHHPGLLQLLLSTATDPAWARRLGDLPAAWAWAKAMTFFLAQREPGLERRLEQQLEEATTTVRTSTAELAAAKAWDAALTRMTSAQSQALRSYQSNMQKMGKGTGKYAHIYAKAARESLGAARGAVPAWVMPLAEVLESVPADRNAFDVVIIDEASQASIESLFLLWLAPRVVVVGDERQCAPSSVSKGELQPIFDKLDSYLPDLPSRLRTSFTPTDSLFSLLTTRFGSVVRLREHFRCMPEIIEFSSRTFYDDSPLVPLRQYGSDRLPPLRLRRVEGASSEGTGAHLRNRGEARAIADQLAACIADPAYDGKTFGVVVLQGRGQIDLIEAEIRQRMSDQAREQHKIRVGTPPEFQGDERNVIMLSMVIGPHHKATALTREEDRRRFNVAASRAQDQMWLFHSAAGTSPADLRSQLITYMVDPPAPRAADDLANVTADQRQDPFDSLFEQRVYLRIRERGYQVTPQWEVNGRRIDLVVTGLKGRLAVECDGEAWHSTPEQRQNDLYREQKLKRAGWQFWRVRESEFVWDPEAALEDLWTTLERRGIRPDEGAEDVDEGRSAVVHHVALADDLGTSPPLPTLTRSPRSSWSPRTPEGVPRPDREASMESKSPPRGPVDGAAPPAVVRAWARAQGLPVGDRGRLSPDVIAAYDVVHPRT